ncbi:MAG: hypothetical protein PHD98_01305 [Bacilli bacterium]|jgi:hypothetical protein|nr:hypothetical protein [Bacilli bacterium]MDD4005786.1 hypothetical protein [Bacilli bacterium]
MPTLTSKAKFLISISTIFALVGVTYLAVGLLKKFIPEGGVRNSTDEIGNRVLLSKGEFTNESYSPDWTSRELGPDLINSKAYFKEEGQNLLSPNLNNNFTKYVEISISEVSGGSDGAFLLSGYDKKGVLLEEVTISNIIEAGQYNYRFAYDHVFIDYLTLTYLAQEATIAVDYISIYALQ